MGRPWRTSRRPPRRHHAVPLPPAGCPPVKPERTCGRITAPTPPTQHLGGSPAAEYREDQHGRERGPPQRRVHSRSSRPACQPECGGSVAARSSFQLPPVMGRGSPVRSRPRARCSHTHRGRSSYCAGAGPGSSVTAERHRSGSTLGDAIGWMAPTQGRGRVWRHRWGLAAMWYRATVPLSSSRPGPGAMAKTLTPIGETETNGHRTELAVRRQAADD